ncbi:MAG: MMPL family transporter [Deltaproteobacteria bacterium]|nr:MMPL family transporter [Deltaproteobacteria bacterium]
MRSLPARVGVACARRPKRTLLLAALALALIVPGILRITVVGDLHRLIPQRSEASTGLALSLEGLTRSDAVYGLIEGPADRDLLLESGEQLCSALEAQDLIESARFRPAEGIPDVDPLLLFDVADVHAEGALAERFSPEGAEARARFIREVLTGPTSGDARAWLLSDPYGLLQLLGERIGRGVQRMDSEEQAFLSPDGEALLLVIRPAYSGVGPDFHEPLYQQLRAAVDAVLTEHPRGAELTVGFTGSFLHTREIARATQEDATMLSTASILAVLLLYLVFYRSLLSLGLVLGLLPMSAVLTLGFGGYAIGELNPMAAGFAAVLFGLGIDPAIHLISRYREARLTLVPLLAAEEALDGVAPAVMMSGLTTSAALFTMAVFDPKAMGQMGVLSGVGVLLNNALMLTVLPALWMVLGERLTADAGVGVGLARGLARFVHRARVGVLVGAALLVTVVLATWKPLDFDASMDAFQPETLEPVRVDRALEARFGEERGKLLVLARGRDEQAVLEVNDAWNRQLEELQKRGEVRGFESLAVLRPADKTARARRVRLGESLDVSGAAQRLGDALTAQGFRADAFAPALDRLASVGTVRDVDRSVERKEREARERRERAEAEAEGVPWTPSWTDWFDAKHKADVDGDIRIVTRVFPAAGRSAADAAELLRSEAPATMAGVEVYVTGLPLVEDENAAKFAHNLGWLLGMAVVALFLVLFTHYRRLRPTLIGLLPLAMALLLFMGLHASLGIQLTVFALASLPLLIGVGIDDHLFMLDRYLEGGTPGRLDDAMAGAGRAILVTTLTTLAAFGVLSLSRFPALASLGQAVIISLVLVFVASLLWMPALLSRYMPGPDAPGSE